MNVKIKKLLEEFCGSDNRDPRSLTPKTISGMGATIASDGEIALIIKENLGYEIIDLWLEGLLGICDPRIRWKVSKSNFEITKASLCESIIISKIRAVTICGFLVEENAFVYIAGIPIKYIMLIIKTMELYNKDSVKVEYINGHNQCNFFISDNVIICLIANTPIKIIKD